jgi:hypothetical protein
MTKNKGILALLGLAVLAVVILFVTGVIGGGNDDSGTGAGNSPTTGDGGSATDGGGPNKGGPRDPRDPARDPELRTVAPEHYVEVQMKSRNWIGILRQGEDEKQKAAALVEIRAALAGTDDVAAYAALQALIGLKNDEIDRTGLQELVMAQLESSSGKLRVGAWFALASLGIKDGVQGLVNQVANDEDSEVRASATRLINMLENGNLTGTSGELVLKILKATEEGNQWTVLQGLDGAQLSPELESSVLDLSRSEDPKIQKAAIYHGISTQANKSEAAVNRLVELIELEDAKGPATPQTTLSPEIPGLKDGGFSSRAAMGLKNGVPDELKGMVAGKALEWVADESSVQLQVLGLDLLTRYAGADQKGKIESLTKDENINAHTRRLLTGILVGL